MKDDDQKLLWEAYLSESTHSGENSCKDGEYFCETDKVCKPKADQKETEETEVDESFDTVKFTAAGREDPTDAVFNAVVNWMKNDSSALVTPEDQDGYDIGTAFDDAKNFIKETLQDISLSEVKEHLSGTLNLGSPEGEAQATPTWRSPSPERPPSV